MVESAVGTGRFYECSTTHDWCHFTCFVTMKKYVFLLFVIISDYCRVVALSPQTLASWVL